MNAKAAKKLRKAIFGDLAFHAPRPYVQMKTGTIRHAPGSPMANYRAGKRAAKG